MPRKTKTAKTRTGAKLTGLANALTRGKKNATARAAINRAITRSAGRTTTGGKMKGTTTSALKQKAKGIMKASTVTTKMNPAIPAKVVTDQRKKLVGSRTRWSR